MEQNLGLLDLTINSLQKPNFRKVNTIPKTWLLYRMLWDQNFPTCSNAVWVVEHLYYRPILLMLMIISSLKLCIHITSSLIKNSENELRPLLVSHK